ncbi:MAG: serine hydrolase [Chloroflexi bacterium]|nr:serine hydrolase [Chloroflexota bacterium]
MRKSYRVITVLLILIFIGICLGGCDSSQPTKQSASHPTATVQATLEPIEQVTTQSTTEPFDTPVSPSETGNVNRTILTYDELMNGFDYNSPIDDGAFAMPDGAALSEHVFDGRLELFGEDTAGGFEVVQGDTDLEPETMHIPEFDFEFVQSGDYLIPVQRGLIIADHPNWNYIIGPGRIWKENGDQGYSRASFPFALTWKGGNATFNGVMTFLFDGENVSNVWYQITQETTTSLRANFWGVLEASYHPEPVENGDKVRDAFAQELADRFPTKPIEQLAVDYPGIDASKFTRGVTPEHITMYGFVINGVNYVGECRTRFGQYAYCEYIRATSYSTAKSAFVSVALMRLAQKYGLDVADLLINDYAPEYANSPGNWDAVTFGHTIDMATGNYESSGRMVDEDGAQMGEYWSTQPYAERIAAAFNWPHATDPGTRWVYRTSDTFILTRALHNYLQSQEGPDADIFQFVVDEVYGPLKIGPGAHTTMRTADDDWQGQPEGGYGLWWIQDDIAKIATLLNNGGKIDGEQILHPDMLADAMQHDPDDRGVDIGRGWKYNNAFWAQEYTEASGFDCDVWVAEMQGVSGNAVILMPNGSTYYYFSDNREFTWDSAVRESNKIISHCP